MTHVYERVTLECPYAQAREYLREALAPLAEEATPQLLALATPAGRGELPKRVLVRFYRGEDPIHFDERWRIFWAPEAEGPYPEFRGELRIGVQAHRRNTFLELQGDFIPPAGEVAQAFDMTLGARIAASTARSLLRHIAEPIERRYEHSRAAAEKL